MKRIINEMKLRLPARSVNEAVARSCVSAFIAEANPTVEELCDLRCAVSEAVTNCIVHAYRGMDRDVCYVYISLRLYDTREVSVQVSDTGCGIEDITLARTPLYTGAQDSERSGLGFTVMETFMDEIDVTSSKDCGTTVTLIKKIGTQDTIDE